MIAKYVQATIEMLESGQKPELVLGNLKILLQKKGHLHLYKNILINLLRRLEQSSQTQIATVTVAKEEAVDELKNAISNALSQLNVTSKPEIITDPNIVGGLLVETKDQRIDATYKSALLRLYRKITN